jgi:hypothetical protein
MLDVDSYWSEPPWFPICLCVAFLNFILPLQVCLPKMCRTRLDLLVPMYLFVNLGTLLVAVLYVPITRVTANVDLTGQTGVLLGAVSLVVLGAFFYLFNRLLSCIASLLSCLIEALEFCWLIWVLFVSLFMTVLFVIGCDTIRIEVPLYITRSPTEHDEHMRTFLQDKDFELPMNVSSLELLTFPDLPTYGCEHFYLSGDNDPLICYLGWSWPQWCLSFVVLSFLISMAYRNCRPKKQTSNTDDDDAEVVVTTPPPATGIAITEAQPDYNEDVIGGEETRLLPPTPVRKQPKAAAKPQQYFTAPRT